VRGTPTLYIGGKKVRVRTVEGMSAMIDEQLKQKGS
jgi:protein-disulfide isomerase